jgi:hypothetical protein
MKMEEVGGGGRRRDEEEGRAAGGMPSPACRVPWVYAKLPPQSRAGKSRPWASAFEVCSSASLLLYFLFF